MTKTVLIVDDESGIRNAISDTLRAEGYVTYLASDAAEAIANLEKHQPCAILLDVWLKGSELDGIGILELIIQRKLPIPVIMMSGYHDIELAVEAMKKGAYDYISKPLETNRLLVVLKNAFEQSSLKRELQELRKIAKSNSELIGESQAAQNLLLSIKKVAATASRVFITGPIGSGKQLAAKKIHQFSRRANEPFVIFSPMNHSAEQISGELFGTDIADMKGNHNRKVGLLERAHMGTLYIDEVTDLPLDAQNILLRFLQNQTVERYGINRDLKLDIRIISATSKNIEEEIATGKFRRDLYYRLNVVPINVPSLAERREDIPHLCKHFMVQMAEFSGLSPRVITQEAIAIMQSYNWPANIRQLRNVVEWMLIMAPGSKDETITAEMLPQEILESSGGLLPKPDNNQDMLSMPLREAREVFERQYLMAQINRFGGNISRTSAFVGMERSALHRKLKSLRISPHNDAQLLEEEEE